MGEFNEGRVAVTFEMGSHIENFKETYEKERDNFEAMRSAFTMIGARMTVFLKQVQEHLKTGKITIKEGEYAQKYITQCIEMAKILFNESDGQRLGAIGAVAALKTLVKNVKEKYDNEKSKLEEINEFESKEMIDYKSRPIGYIPNKTPLEVYKEETDKTIVRDAIDDSNIGVQTIHTIEELPVRLYDEVKNSIDNKITKETSKKVRKSRRQKL